MGQVIPIGPAGLSAEALAIETVMRALGSLPRAVLDQIVMNLIDLLDRQDGDVDQEDATNAEDDFRLWRPHDRRGDGPGCDVSDCDAAVDDFPIDEGGEQ